MLAAGKSVADLPLEPPLSCFCLPASMISLSANLPAGAPAGRFACLQVNPQFAANLQVIPASKQKLAGKFACHRSAKEFSAGKWCVLGRFRQISTHVA